MKYFILILINLATAFTSFAGKNHTLTITVSSLYDSIPLKDLNVFIEIKEKKEMLGTTDAQGKYFFPKMSDKYFDLIIEDPSEKYQTRKITIFKSEDTEQQKEISLKYNLIYETALFQKIDTQYESETQSFLRNLYDKKQIDTAGYQLPQFSGGIKELYRFVANNVEYPQASLEEGIQGKVFLEFIIQKDGQITHVKVIKSVDKDLDTEAMRVLRYTKKWKPAMQNNTPVQSAFKVPINFHFE